MKTPFSTRPLGLIVNYQSWLQHTETWIHTQVKFLPDWVKADVVCGVTRNLDQFSVDRLHCYSDLSSWEQVKLMARFSATLGCSLGRRNALIAEVAKRRGASIVHSHFGHTAWSSAKAIHRLGLKHVVTFYGVDMSALPASQPVWAKRYQLLFRLVDRVLCEGPVMAEKVRQLGCPPDKLEVHHLGVDLSGLPFVNRVWRPGEPLHVLIAASFREKKGIPTAILALAELRKTFPLKLTVVGDAQEDPKSQNEKAKILSTVEATGMSECTTFLGCLSHRELLEQAYRHHVFLSPSMTASDGDTEGGAPVTLIEMAATGIPVISTTHADIPMVIEDGIGGYLATEGSVTDLLACLQRLMAAPETWALMAQAARGKMEREFDARRQGMRLASIYEKLVAGAGV